MAKRKAYGRIKKAPGALYERKFTSRVAGQTVSYNVPIGIPAGRRTLGVKVFVQRNTGAGVGAKGSKGSRVAAARANYEALACIRGAAFRGKTTGCGTFQYGRTVQSAVAKALKSLATKTALRGRKG